MDLIEEVGLALHRRRSPADMQPHQHEGPVEEVEPVGGVGPPGSDVEGDPWVTDRSVEPRLVARPEDGGEGRLGRDARARRHPQVRRPAHRVARGRAPGRAVARARPGTAVRRPAVGEGRRAVAVGPVDAELGTESLEDPADESVVAGAGDGGLGQPR